MRCLACQYRACRSCDGSGVKMITRQVYAQCACVCVCMCVYVCVRVCMYVCTYACMYAYICMYVCVHIYVCIHMHVCMYACMHACMYVCMYVCMYAYARIRLTHRAASTVRTCSLSDRAGHDPANASAVPTVRAFLSLFIIDSFFI